MAGTNERLHLATHLLVSLRSLGGQMVGTTVDIGIAVTVIFIKRINHSRRLLRRGGIVEVHQRMAMHLNVKYRKLFSNILCIHYHL